MPDSIQTWFITDVPFWECQTGAQFRIQQLVEQLNIDPFQSQVLFTQSAENYELDQQVGSTPVAQMDLSKPPKSGGWANWKWRTRATLNAIGIARSTWSPTFQRYYSPELVDRFVSLVRQHEPDVLVFEYATQTQLLKAIPPKARKRIVSVLDTHDILWQRAKQFRTHNEDHWIEVSQAEEENAIREFDLVLAIQPNEADYFRGLIGSDKVQHTAVEFSVSDHSATKVVQANCSVETDVDSRGLTIGFIASRNAANLDTTRQILAVWPELHSKKPDLKLCLAGSICDAPEIRSETKTSASIELLGAVETLSHFYSKIDLIWNPVRFGTGLKIKNLEAMAFSKCLVTSPHGAEGLRQAENLDPIQNSPPYHVLESSGEMVQWIENQGRDQILETARNGINYIKSHFGPGTQYLPLRQKIRDLHSRKLS